MADVAHSARHTCELRRACLEPKEMPKAPQLVHLFPDIVPEQSDGTVSLELTGSWGAPAEFNCLFFFLERASG